MSDHPYLSGGMRYLVICPVCHEPNQDTSEDERGTLYLHEGREFPCRMVHHRNEVGAVSVETLREIQRRMWKIET